MAGVLVRVLASVLGRFAVTGGSFPHSPGVVALTEFFPVEAGVEPPSSIDWGPGLCYCIPENGSAVQWKAHGGVLQGLDRPGFHRLTGAHLPVDAGAPNVEIQRERETERETEREREIERERQREKETERERYRERERQRDREIQREREKVYLDNL